jgi:hypothetical protein
LFSFEIATANFATALVSLLSGQVWNGRSPKKKLGRWGVQRSTSQEFRTDPWSEDFLQQRLRILAGVLEPIHDPKNSQQNPSGVQNPGGV